MDNRTELIVSKSYVFGLFRKRAYIEYRAGGLIRILKVRFYVLWFVPVYSHNESL
jgi:hypothetical protein